MSAKPENRAGRSQPDGPPHNYDPYLESIQAKLGRRTVRNLVPLTLDAIRVVRRGAPAAALALLATQVLAGVALVVQLWLAKEMLQRLLVQEPVDQILRVLVPAVLLVGALFALTAWQGFLQSLMSAVVTRSTWQRLVRTTSSVELVKFDSPAYFDRLQRVSTNALSRPLQLVQAVISLVSGIVGSISLAVAVIVIEPLLAPLLVIFAVPLFLIARVGGRVEFEFALAMTANIRQRFALTELLTERESAKEIRAFALASLLTQRLDVLYDDYLAAMRAKTRKRLRLSLITAAISSLLGAAAIGLLVALVVNGQVTFASAAIAVTAVLLLVQRLGQLSTGVSNILETGLFLHELEDFTTDAGAARRALGEVVLRPSRLTLSDVGFRYPGSQNEAITGIDLEIEAGQVVAIVGENGSGKTTLSKLLANLYTPSAGSVAWDGVDLRALDASEVGRSIAVLFQDFLRFELSLADNVAVGDPTSLDDRVRTEMALEKMGLRHLASTLPQGLDSFMSPRFPGGSDLSTGQWQRVAMARALFRDAPIVILDEPTASLDAKAEIELFETMQSMLRGRTVVLVTHRMASTRQADQIIVLDRGRIIEHGTHGSLLAAEGHYASLYRAQAAAYEAGTST